MKIYYCLTLVKMYQMYVQPPKTSGCNCLSAYHSDHCIALVKDGALWSLIIFKKAISRQIPMISNIIHISIE